MTAARDRLAVRKERALHEARVRQARVRQARRDEDRRKRKIAARLKTAALVERKRARA